MFQVIEKDQYFDALNDPLTCGRLDAVQRQIKGLKHIQDAWILHELRNVQGLKIIEIGGGYLRALRTLTSNNEIWNLDAFADHAGSPSLNRKIPQPKDWKLVLDFLGSYSKEVPSSYFDVAVSISVIEHVPEHDYENFWNDHARILKSGGIACHAIDFYIGDKLESRVENRLDLLLNSIEKSGLRLRYPATLERPLTFKSSFASHPDYGMWERNKLVSNPKMIRIRSCNQSVSLAVVLEKK